MKMLLSEEVKKHLRKMAPEPRQKILLALSHVEKGNTPLLALEDDLDGFYKVVIGPYRVICAVESNRIFALFTENRSVVYEIATANFLNEILRRQKT